MNQRRRWPKERAGSSAPRRGMLLASSAALRFCRSISSRSCCRLASRVPAGVDTSAIGDLFFLLLAEEALHALDLQLQLAFGQALDPAHQLPHLVVDGVAAQLFDGLGQLGHG